jgi:hypothetical protein
MQGASRSASLPVCLWPDPQHPTDPVGKKYFIQQQIHP